MISLWILKQGPGLVDKLVLGCIVSAITSLTINNLRRFAQVCNLCPGEQCFVRQVRPIRQADIVSFQCFFVELCREFMIPLKWSNELKVCIEKDIQYLIEHGWFFFIETYYWTYWNFICYTNLLQHLSCHLWCGLIWILITYNWLFRRAPPLTSVKPPLKLEQES